MRRLCGIVLVTFTGATGAGVHADGPPIDRWLRTWQPEPGQWSIGDLSASGPGGEVYLVGRIDQGDGDTDLALNRYDVDGTLAWSRTYGGPGAGSEMPVDIAITEQGVAVLASSLGKGGLPQTVLLDYAGDGTLRWEARTLGEDFPGFLRPRLAIGVNGQRVFAADNGHGAGSLERYAADGTFVSAHPLDFFGFGGVSALAVDDDLNAILVAVNEFSRYDVMKIDPGGAVEWTYTEADNTGLVLSEAVIAMMPNGDAIVAGSPEVFCADDGVTVNALLWRLAPDGTLRWRRALPPDPCAFLIVNDLAVGPAGETYLAAGGDLGTGTLVRLDADGTIAWTRTAAEAGFDANFRQVVVGAHGQVIVGAAESEAPPPIPFALRGFCYGADGTLGWTARLGGTPEARYLLTGLAAAPDGSVSMAATIRPDEGPMTAVTIRLDFAACAGDLDDDGAVDFDDLLRLLAAWGAEDDHPADLDGDGVVAFPDLLRLLAIWGPCRAAINERRPGARGRR